MLLPVVVSVAGQERVVGKNNEFQNSKSEIQN